MSEEKVSLDPRVTLAADRRFLARGLGARVLTLTAEVCDLQHRFTAMESRFTALESRVSALEIAMTARLDAMSTRLDAIERRFAIQEERMSAMLALIVRVAERLDGTPRPPVRLKVCR